MSGAAEETARPRRVSRRTEYLTYASGLLTDSQTEFITFLIPLLALALGFGPLELGILVSAKAVVPSVLAIHGGVLMDRYGTRLILILVGVGCALFPPLFPVSGWFPALLFLQMAVGMFTTFAWMGAQSLVVKVGKDAPAIVGRFAFSARIGVMVAPLAAGLMWDFVSPWLAFLIIGAIGAVFVAAVTGIPARDVDPELEARREAGEMPPFRLRDILPRLSDYIGAIGLMAIPAVAFVVVISSVRISSALMQQSFYILYLKELGLQATAIGGFVTVSQLAAAGGTLLAARLTRYVHPHWVYMGTVATSVLFIYATPVFGGVIPLLIAAIAVRGAAQGASQPVMYMSLSDAVGPDRQATAIGLRSTGNRVASLVVPAFMGAVAEAWGLDATFYVTGALLLALIAAATLWFRARREVPAR